MSRVKKAVYWLMGERGGRVTVATWNWLMGVEPVGSEEASSANHVATAQTSLEAMQASVSHLMKIASQQSAAYKQARQSYETKVRQITSLEKQAETAQVRGDMSSARLALSRALQMEQFLPQLETRVQQAEDLVRSTQGRLESERMRLETYKIEMQNIQEMAALDETLKAISNVNQTMAVEDARAEFEAARDALEDRYVERQALNELTHGSDVTELDRNALDAELERRLQRNRDRQK
ncbi:MAG: PspA/IM30 family protein [Geitlerinemataceae cyanobacterium]